MRKTVQTTLNKIFIVFIMLMIPGTTYSMHDLYTHAEPAEIELNLQFKLLALPGAQQDLIHAVVYAQPKELNKLTELSSFNSDAEEFLKEPKNLMVLYKTAIHIEALTRYKCINKLNYINNPNSEKLSAIKNKTRSWWRYLIPATEHTKQDHKNWESSKLVRNRIKQLSEHLHIKHANFLTHSSSSGSQ